MTSHLHRQHTAPRCTQSQHTAAYCNTLHHTATHGPLLHTIHGTATHCTTLQHCYTSRAGARKIPTPESDHHSRDLVIRMDTGIRNKIFEVVFSNGTLETDSEELFLILISILITIASLFFLGTGFNTLQYFKLSPSLCLPLHTTMPCNTLQHTARHCKTL